MSNSEQRQTWWLIELPSSNGPTTCFIGQFDGPLPSGRAKLSPFSPDANDAVAARMCWKTEDEAKQALMRFRPYGQQDYYLLEHCIVTEHIFVGDSGIHPSERYGGQGAHVEGGL